MGQQRLRLRGGVPARPGWRGCSGAATRELMHARAVLLIMPTR